MNRRIAILAAVAALSFAPSARAAETARVGIGVGVEPFNFFGHINAPFIAGGPLGNTPPVSFYVPINVLPNLRIEPQIGYWHIGANPNNVPNGTDYSLSAFSIGAGAFFYVAPATPVGFYVGGRLAVVYNKVSTLVTQGPPQVIAETSETDFSIAPTVGGEYAVLPRFTVGAELQLPITFYGNPSTTAAGTTVTTNLDRGGVSTNAVIFLRYFFL